MTVQVLIIDGDSSAAMVTEAIVKRIAPSAIVNCESTAERGWLSMQQVVPDVLIMDPVAHSLDSMLLIRLCQDHLPNTRIVVLASAPTPGLRAVMKHLNIDVYLEKPAALATLTEQLHIVLARREEGLLTQGP